MARLHRVQHKGKSLLHLDLTNLKPGEFKPVFAEAVRALQAGPRKSSRVVTDVSGARFDPATLLEFERFVREVMPFLAANAIVGVSGIQRVAWIALRKFYECPAELVDSVDAGKDWLVTS